MGKILKMVRCVIRLKNKRLKTMINNILGFTATLTLTIIFYIEMIILFQP